MTSLTSKAVICSKIGILTLTFNLEHRLTSYEKALSIQACEKLNPSEQVVEQRA